MQIVKRLALKGFVRSRHQLSMLFCLGEHQFSKTYRYPDVDLIGLEQRFGPDNMERVYFHMAAFEAMPLASLQPEVFDLGLLARFYTSGFESLWRTVFRNAGAQWRYENDLPDYDGPMFDGTLSNCAAAAPIDIKESSVQALCFSGGGKDSLVAMKLLERGHVPFSSYAYSHPAYGEADSQHDLIDGLLHAAIPRRRHQMRISDEFASGRGRALERDYGVQTRLCVETPTAVFGGNKGATRREEASGAPTPATCTGIGPGSTSIINGESRSKRKYCSAITSKRSWRTWRTLAS